MKEFETLAHTCAELIKIIDYISFFLLWNMDYEKVHVLFNIATLTYVRNKKKYRCQLVLLVHWYILSVRGL